MIVSEQVEQAKSSGVCMHNSCERKYYTTGECKVHHNKRWFADNPTYWVYVNMKSRCLRVTCPEYKNYGARGISICEKWLNGVPGKSGYRCFLEDIGGRPTPLHEIDRINPLGNYEPSNCRWVTENVQSINTRPVHRNNTTGYKGVNKVGNSWYATLKVNNNYYHSSYLKTKQEAIDYRRMLEDKYHKPLLEGVSK